jgi:hypothetical protein
MKPAEKQKNGATRLKIAGLVIGCIICSLGVWLLIFYALSWPMESMVSSKTFYKVIHTIDTEYLPGISEIHREVNMVLKLILLVIGFVALMSKNVRNVLNAAYILAGFGSLAVLISIMDLYTSCYPQYSEEYVGSSSCTSSLMAHCSQLVCLVSLSVLVLTANGRKSEATDVKSSSLNPARSSSK